MNKNTKTWYFPQNMKQNLNQNLENPFMIWFIYYLLYFWSKLHLTSSQNKPIENFHKNKTQKPNKILKLHFHDMV